MKNVITFEEAREIAKEREPYLNEAAEFNDAWHFYLNDGQTHDGGGASGFVILKEGGQILMPYEYFFSNRKIIDMDNVIRLNP